jgi:hypothetical protein
MIFNNVIITNNMNKLINIITDPHSNDRLTKI